MQKDYNRRKDDPDYAESLKQGKAESDLMNLLSPFCCPVCRGSGLVPNGFYRQISGRWDSTSTEPEKCRSCDGTGIVWSNLLGIFYASY